MHEHKLAEDMVASLLKTMRENGGVGVARVTVELSEMGGESEHALRHGFEEKSEGTAIEGAELVVEMVGPKLRCRDCGHEWTLEAGSGSDEAPPEECPSCGRRALLIVPQSALVIKHVEIELPED